VIDTRPKENDAETSKTSENDYMQACMHANGAECLALASLCRVFALH